VIDTSTDPPSVISIKQFKVKDIKQASYRAIAKTLGITAKDKKRCFI
jgi:hypothetical protein